MDPNVQLNNIRASYRDIRTQVDIALRAFVGDAPRLGQVRTLASSLLHAAQQVRHSNLDYPSLSHPCSATGLDASGRV